jgi:hypothetical protein
MVAVLKYGTDVPSDRATRSLGIASGLNNGRW